MLKKGKKYVAIGIGKDLCSWWDYENSVENMVTASCLEEFLNISFSFSTPL